MDLDHQPCSLPNCYGEKSSRSMPRKVSYEDEADTPNAKASSFKNDEFDEFIPVYPAPQDAKKKSSKNVMFNESIGVFPISDMSNAEKTELYYDNEDYKRFKTEVSKIRNLVIRRTVQASAANPNTTKTQHATAIVLNDPDLRSLGRYLCPSQLMNKTMVMTTMKTYRQSLVKSTLPLHVKEEILADGYSKLCQWSQNHALETASINFMQVYGHRVPASSTITVDITAGTESKRPKLDPAYVGPAQIPIKDKLLAAVGVQPSSTTSLPVASKAQQSPDQNKSVHLFPELTRKRKRFMMSLDLHDNTSSK